MLEFYLDGKFHLSSKIWVLEVEKPWILEDFQAKSLYKLHREFEGYEPISPLFQLPPPVSPSSGGFFRPNKFLACVVMSQKAQK